MADKSGETRYGQRSGSGANEPKHNEKKEVSPDREPRQGGDQTKGKGTKGHDTVATRDHLEGSEQGPA